MQGFCYTKKKNLILRGRLDILENLNRVRKHSKLKSFGITDEMLGAIEGFASPAVGYAEIIEDLHKAIDILPEGKTVNFVDVVAHGNRGLVNNSAVGYVDRRHSWYTLKKIQENEAFFKNADEIVFEKPLENLEHMNNAVPDIYIQKGRITYIGEVFAGQTGVKTNLSTQTIRYCADIVDLNHLRFFCHKSQSKDAIISAWKEGGVLDNDKVIRLFKKYDNDMMLDKFTSNISLETYLKNNDEWFELIFNSNFK